MSENQRNGVKKNALNLVSVPLYRSHHCLYSYFPLTNKNVFTLCTRKKVVNHASGLSDGIIKEKSDRFLSTAKLNV